MVSFWKIERPYWAYGVCTEVKIIEGEIVKLPMGLVHQQKHQKPKMALENIFQNHPSLVLIPCISQSNLCTC
ncbi:hypothetical protein LXL04_033942 [Taraxacum kok-saghyz]